MAKIIPSQVIHGVVVVELVPHGDARGVFVETYRREWIPGGAEMVQANRADRCAGSVTGLHYHPNQADYWYVTSGAARVVLHDLRRSSPTTGATLTMDLGRSPYEHTGIYIPPGVAHGFGALTDITLTYMVSHYYDTAEELGVAWDDPDIGADWGVDDPVLTERDRSNPRKADIPAERLPR
ncbi:MAG TPA: dTDP-4-dehydrorhamnose 3,5-epimerase [Actinomycetota bacterium]|nr:dTDP-4-dehydrorhamnose 3,5-epimerase [Actinomycetota bacterium]